jgi:hypothetical protein
MDNERAKAVLDLFEAFNCKLVFEISVETLINKTLMAWVQLNSEIVIVEDTAELVRFVKYKSN